jgi:hypothetical protein
MGCLTFQGSSGDRLFQINKANHTNCASQNNKGHDTNKRRGARPPRESFVKQHEEIAFSFERGIDGIILWRKPAGQLLFGAALFASGVQ